MIKNEWQYRVTKAKTRELAKAIEETGRQPGAETIAPLLIESREGGLRVWLERLNSEIAEYEEVKAGLIPAWDWGLLEQLPKMLIQARIAMGMTQKDLAELMGLKQQQIQRYESTDYVHASLGRIIEVAMVLRVAIRNTQHDPPLMVP